MAYFQEAHVEGDFTVLQVFFSNLFNDIKTKRNDLSVKLITKLLNVYFCPSSFIRS